MAKELRTHEYRFSHGKRPGGVGCWAFRVSAFRVTSRYQLESLRVANLASVTFESDSTAIIIFNRSMKYTEATRILRVQLRSDRYAIIDVLP